MKRKSINRKVKKAVALIASLSIVSCQFSGVMSVNAAETGDTVISNTTEVDKDQTEKPAEKDDTEVDKPAETDKDQTGKTAEKDDTEVDKPTEADKDQTGKTAEKNDTEVDKPAETDKDQTGKTTDTDETEKTGKIKAEPCLSVESQVVPASAAGSRVLITVYVDDKNMSGINYYQQPDVYIDIDRRLKYIGFKNGIYDGSKGMGLAGEMVRVEFYSKVRAKGALGVLRTGRNTGQTQQG